jgi:hypothetical protein
VSADLLANLNSNVALFGGELYRRKPGFLPRYIQKYCVITRLSFCYYRDKAVATRCPQKPLLRIPLSSIALVRKGAGNGLENTSKTGVSQSAQWVSNTKPTSFVPQYHLDILLKEGGKVEIQDDEAVDRAEGDGREEQPKSARDNQRGDELEGSLHWINPLDSSNRHEHHTSMLKAPQTGLHKDRLGVSMSSLLLPRHTPLPTKVLFHY